MSGGGTGLDSGAAVYADIPLDYLDTGRDQPTVTPQSNADTPSPGVLDAREPEQAPGVSEAFDRAFALLIEHGEGGRTRRRLVVSLAAADRARRRAEERGQWCRVAVVRLSVVAELERDPVGGGDTSCPG